MIINIIYKNSIIMNMLNIIINYDHNKKSSSSSSVQLLLSPFFYIFEF